MCGDLLNNFHGVGDDQQRIGLANDQLAPLRLNLLAFVVSPQFLNLRSSRKKLLHSPGNVIAGNGHSEKLETTNLFLFDELPGIDPFLSKLEKIGFELVAFVPCVEQEHLAHRLVFLFPGAVLCHCEGKLALWQRNVIIEVGAQLTLQRFDEFLAPSGQELLSEGPHGRAVPELTLRRGLENLTNSSKVRHSHHE